MTKKTSKKVVKKAAKKKVAPKRPAKVVKRIASKVAQSVSSFPLSPLGDRLILEEVKDLVEQTSSGIYLPASAQDADKETKKGRVVAAGPGRYDDGDLLPMSVKVGDIVLYSWGDKVKVDGVEYTIVRESDVTAIIRR